MGIPVLIYGKSGSGKSRSLKNFAEDEICLVNVLGKPLPFKGSFKYSTISDDAATIMNALAKMPAKVAVIDDFGYIMTNMFMKGHGSGDQFRLYNQIGDTVWNFISYIQSAAVPKDAIIYLVMHEDLDEAGGSKLRTIGKLLDQKVCIEGMVTVVLHSIIKGGRHVFVTNSDGGDIAKSPEGMFEELEVENDLKFVDDCIRSYWGMNAAKKGGK